MPIGGIKSHVFHRGHPFCLAPAVERQIPDDALWLHWEALPSPGVKSSKHDLYVAKPTVHQGLCHTGTALFGRSGSVENKRLITGEVPYVCQYLILWNGERTSRMGLLIERGITHVNDHARVRFLLPVSFGRRNAWYGGIG